LRRIAILAAVAIALMALAPAAALAQNSSTCQAYSSQLCSSVSNNSSGSGTLPFTGLDVVLLVAGGGTLLSAGFLVRRLSRRLD
jgi:hypothetical protein